MWIVIAHEWDLPAKWAAAGLWEMGLDPVLWVPAEDLGGRTLWHHELSSDTTASIVRLEDGRTIESSQVNGVLNRLLQVPDGHMRSMQPGDQSYVYQEMAAFYLSWLNSFDCPVLNPPRPHGLPGWMLQPSAWHRLVALAGLKVSELRLSSDVPIDQADGLTTGAPADPNSNQEMRLIVVGDDIVSAAQEMHSVPDSVGAACIKLSQLSGIPLLGIVLARDQDGGWEFKTAEPLTDLRLGGNGLVEALANALRRPKTEILGRGFGR